MQVNDDGLPTYIAAVVAVRRKCLGASMTAQLSEYATSGPMAGDENGGGSSSNDSGGVVVVGGCSGDESAAERRVVMIAFKMENDCDEETAAGPSRDDSNSESHAMVELELEQQQSPPSFSSDGNTAGKTTYILFFRTIMSSCVLCVKVTIEGVFLGRGKRVRDGRTRRPRTSGSSRLSWTGRARGATLSLFFCLFLFPFARSAAACPSLSLSARPS